MEIKRAGHCKYALLHHCTIAPCVIIYQQTASKTQDHPLANPPTADINVNVNINPGRPMGL
jgi:hypothetical protein